MSLKKTFSSIGIQLLAKWQFCNTTQVPLRTPSSISLTAIGPWPCPRDKENSLDEPKPCIIESDTHILNQESDIIKIVCNFSKLLPDHRQTSTKYPWDQIQESARTIAVCNNVSLNMRRQDRTAAVLQTDDPFEL